jgi:hypothetical protein
VLAHSEPIFISTTNAKLQKQQIQVAAYSADQNIHFSNRYCQRRASPSLSSSLLIVPPRRRRRRHASLNFLKHIPPRRHPSGWLKKT